MTPIKGIIPATITCFASDGKLDLKATRAHLEFVIAGGVHGVFALGTNGEAPLLTLEEKRRVIDAVTEHVAGRVPVIVGVGCPGTWETVELARHASVAGADALSVVTPYYFPLTCEGIAHHYQTVAGATTLPLYIYHIPKRTGNTLSLDVVKTLAQVPNICGMKDSTGEIAWLAEIHQNLPKFSLLVGTDSLLYEGLSLGSDGCVSAIANVFPKLVVRLYTATVQGNGKEAALLQEKILRIRSLFRQFPYLSAIKLSLELCGFSVGSVRAPLVSPTPSEKERLKATLEALDIVSTGCY